jgi:hypothetical protein
MLSAERCAARLPTPRGAGDVRGRARSVVDPRSTVITKQSPQGQLLTVTWRTLLSMADRASDQYRWMLTGLAAMLALVVANLDSLQKVVSGGHLKLALVLLIVSVALAAVAYMLSTSLIARNEVMNKLEAVLSSVEGKALLSQTSLADPELRREVCSPFFGPMKWIVVRSMEKGARDQFAGERGSIFLLVWQAYAIWASVAVAAASMITLVLGLA